MSKSPAKILSYKRRVLFRIISIVLSLSLLIVAELGLRLFSYGGSMRLFVDHKVENYEDYYIVNPFVGLKYFNHFKATEATNDIFLKRKPENGFRIFVLGSSTIYGFPYERNLMATRILHKRLQDAYPDKAIELRDSFTAVLPGYHMNKRHWNTILINNTISTLLIKEWIDHSYNLVVQSLPKKTQLELLSLKNTQT